MEEISVINNIMVPAGMEDIAEAVKNEYIAYLKKQDGFISSTFFKSIEPEKDGTIKYINMVIWQSYAHYKKVVNLGFSNAQGIN